MNKKINKKLKTSKKSLVKNLQKEATKLCYRYTFLRDLGKCQVQEMFPMIAVNHSDIMQSDHCFSRSIHELFFDVSNRTLICSTCNCIKGSGNICATKKDAVTIAVHEIVKHREGIDAYNRMLEIAQRKCAFKDWSNPLWLDGQVKVLKSMIADIENG